MSNVSRHLRAVAEREPEKIAVRDAQDRCLTFAQLDAECDRFAEEFVRHGVQPGMRVVVFVRPGLAFVPTLFGCFRMGAIPICIDPGMKLRQMLECIRGAAPSALIGTRRARLVARLFPRTFGSAKIRVRAPTITPGVFARVPRPLLARDSADDAAVLFTSGSTGVPKGVVYTHGAFDEQLRLLRATYDIGPDEIDLVVFPLFALFSAAWGITAIIPRMDPARPARADGRHLADLIERYEVTHSSGSPAIWRNVVQSCEESGRRLPSLRRILMAGAQVPERLVRRASALGIKVHTPYGATEALPLTTIDDQNLFLEYASTRTGAGTCVGRPLEGVDIAIIPFVAGPIEVWDEKLRLSIGTRGEIAVRAPWVTREYFHAPEATRLAKIPSESGVWHRMGDVGYLDRLGRLWFCGRKDHRIFRSDRVLFPDPIEAIFDNHPRVRRSALVGVGPEGRQRAVLVVEAMHKSDQLRRDLRSFARSLECAEAVDAIVFSRHFPVDTRHNIKIDRPALARRVERSF